MKATAPSGRRPRPGSTRAASRRRCPRPRQPELEGSVRPEEGPEPDPEHEPRRAPEKRGGPAVADKGSDRKRDRSCHGKRERAGDAVHRAKRRGRVDVQDLRRLRTKRFDPACDALRAPERHDDGEAERRIVQDDQQVALLPHRTCPVGVEQQIRTGIGPRDERPRGDPEHGRAGQPGEDSCGQGSQSARQTCSCRRAGRISEALAGDPDRELTPTTPRPRRLRQSTVAGGLASVVSRANVARSPPRDTAA
jgi:hypothetical protein